jgi:hypothetical protein
MGASLALITGMGVSLARVARAGGRELSVARFASLRILKRLPLTVVIF